MSGFTLIHYHITSGAILAPTVFRKSQFEYRCCPPFGSWRVLPVSTHKSAKLTRLRSSRGCAAAESAKPTSGAKHQILHRLTRAALIIQHESRMQGSQSSETEGRVESRIPRSRTVIHPAVVSCGQHVSQHKEYISRCCCLCCRR